MNKRIVLIACTCLLSCQVLRAQDAEQPLPKQKVKQELLPAQSQPHEVYLGYGIFSLPVMIHGLGDLILGGSIRDIDVVGPVMAGYTYFPSRRIGVGLEAGYTTYTTSFRSDGEKERNSYLVVMPHGELYWARLRGVEFFSGVKLGACFIQRPADYGSGSQHSIIPAFHFTTIGTRVGNILGFYMDSGIGFDGLTNAGLSLRF
ncbi:hypothetical protein [Pontibacter liquoris]|uniref:hypothetical protein n=1 Tax=Pontibacter liquoris TaxID=2905677 RepID=UPI001FA72EEF|nr:hypothetical protein [Pontibacter liquoris]